MKIDDSYLARRRFLCGMIGGGAAALAAGAAVPLTCYVGNLHHEPPPAFVELPAEQFRMPPGTSKLLMYGRIPALLIQTPGRDSVLRAFVATCTHFDCTVGYHEQENQILCACHGGSYDIEGKPTGGPPPRALRPFHIGLRDEKLILALEKDDLDRALASTKA